MKNLFDYKTLIIITYALCMGLIFIVFTKYQTTNTLQSDVKGVSVDISADSNTVNVSAYIKTSLLRFRVFPEKRIPRTGNWATISTVVLRNCTNNKTYTFNNVPTDAQGYGELTIDDGMALFDGPYRWYVKGYSHLNKSFNCYAMDVAKNFVDLTKEGKELLAGEVSIIDDNYVNALDISVLINHIYTPDYGSDLNQDTRVNSLDFSNQLFNFYTFGD